MKRLLPSLLFLLLLAPSGTHGREADPGNAFSLLPDTPGTVWIYAGEATGFDGAGNRPVKRKVESTVTLETVERAKAAALYRFRGFFGELSSAGETPAPRLLLVRRDGLYAPFVEAPEKASPGSLFNAVGPADLFLPVPFKVGTRFGEAGMMKIHPPGRYSWLVESAFPFDLATVKGAGQGKVTGYRLVYHTNPDSQTLDFVPGLGVTRFTYEHHGTPGAHDLTLKEIRK